MGSVEAAKHLHQPTAGRPIAPWCWAVPLLLAAAVSLITIDGGFVFDDYAAIQINPLVTSDQVPYWDAFRRDLWGVPMGRKILGWRPLLPMVWKLLWSLWPDSPLPFRILSLLLHVAATGAALLAGRRLLERREVLWTAGAVFAVHAVHAEAIGAIVSQCDILSTVLGLLALWVVLERKPFRCVMAAVLLLLACLAKETAVVFGGVIALVLLFSIDEWQKKGEWFLTLGGVCLVTTAVVLFQLSLDRTVNVSYNLAYEAHGSSRVLLGLHLIGRTAAMCFVPFGLAPTHVFAAMDLEPSTLLPFAVTGAAFAVLGLAGLWMAVRSRNTAWIVGWSLLCGPILMQSNLLVPITTNLAERLLYGSSVASSAMLAALLFRIDRTRLRNAAVAVVLVAMLAQSWHAQRPWRTNLSLFRYAVAVEPLAWIARHNYAKALLEEAGPESELEAAWYYATAWYIESQGRAGGTREDLLPIVGLDEMPRDRWYERLVEAPPIIRPENPCAVASFFMIQLKPAFPTLSRSIVRHYTKYCDKK